MSLKINEIFYSIQGESVFVGLPTVFVRLSGCPLRCVYCDTSYAFYDGKRMGIDLIVKKIASFPAKRVCITGGEPLAQPLVLSLMQELCDLGYNVSVETSGALSVAKIDDRVSVVLDLKTPASGEVEKNLWENLSYLKPIDQVKIVICDREDFVWAENVIRTNSIPQGCEWMLSPVTPGLDAKLLAEWILAANPFLPVRLQIQLHKYLWDDSHGR
jgi:7-carboxy-7-deazaguanine synthase